MSLKWPTESRQGPADALTCVALVVLAWDTVKLMLTFIWMGLGLLTIGICIVIVMLHKLRSGQAELHQTLKNHLIFHVAEDEQVP